LALRTAALQELEALEDEERREPAVGNWQDGSRVRCRSSTDTGWSVSALE
jgi:hypothetical protein